MRRAWPLCLSRRRAASMDTDGQTAHARPCRSTRLGRLRPPLRRRASLRCRTAASAAVVISLCGPRPTRAAASAAAGVPRRRSHVRRVTGVDAGLDELRARKAEAADRASRQARCAEVAGPVAGGDEHGRRVLGGAQHVHDGASREATLLRAVASGGCDLARGHRHLCLLARAQSGASELERAETPVVAELKVRAALVEQIPATPALLPLIDVDATRWPHEERLEPLHAADGPGHHGGRAFL